MCVYNGLTQRKSKSETPPAVCHPVRACVEHIKYLLFIFIRNTRTIIGYRNNSPVIFPESRNPDLRSPGSIFNCIIHQIYNNLNNQLCIHFCQKQIILMIYCNMMLHRKSVYMAEGFRNYLVCQFCGNTKIQPALFQPGNRQQIFHKVDQPHGVIINILIQSLFCAFVKQTAV